MAVTSSTNIGGTAAYSVDSAITGYAAAAKGSIGTGASGPCKGPNTDGSFADRVIASTQG